LRGASQDASSRTSVAVMCRSSARGCTVMPGAPASTQTFAASSTDGSRPPRELRSVATLLMLTDSFTMAALDARGRTVARHGVRNLLGACGDLGGVAAFQHDPQQRFCSRVTDEQAPLPGKPLLDLLQHLGDLRH